MVAVPHVRRERAHTVLEAERDTGVDVGLGLRDGDVEPLTLDDLLEALRHIHVLPDFRVGDEVVHHRFFLEVDELDAVVFGDAVKAGHLRIEPGDQTGAFADLHIAAELDEVLDDRVEHTWVRGLRVVDVELAGFLQIHKDQVRFDEHLAAAELIFPTGRGVQVVEALADSRFDRLDVRALLIRGRAVVFRQADMVAKVVHRRRLGDDDCIFLILNTHLFFLPYNQIPKLKICANSNIPKAAPTRKWQTGIHLLKIRTLCRGGESPETVEPWLNGSTFGFFEVKLIVRRRCLTGCYPGSPFLL